MKLWMMLGSVACAQFLIIVIFFSLFSGLFWFFCGNFMDKTVGFTTLVGRAPPKFCTVHQARMGFRYFLQMAMKSARSGADPAPPDGMRDMNYFHRLEIIRKDNTSFPAQV